MCYCEIAFTPIGLSFDIIGVALLFWFGLPSKIKPVISDMKTDIHTSDEKKDIERKNRLIILFSRSGLASLVLGFSFQILGWIFQNYNLCILSCDCGCQ